MLISIITPSYRRSAWLKLAIASVADQSPPPAPPSPQNCRPFSLSPSEGERAGVRGPSSPSGSGTPSASSLPGSLSPSQGERAGVRGPSSPSGQGASPLQIEHLIQDAGSDDATLDWLPQDPRVRAFVEPDLGMYDALNRGLRRANGDLLACLNCDEQYLPGALATVAAYFDQHPHIDLLFGNVLFVDTQGRYLHHRKMQTPLKYHTWTCHLSTLTCAMFFRRRVIADYGLLFDPRLRDVGDAEWMLRLLQRRVKMAALGQFTSAFTCTGDNMSAGPNARRENLELRRSAPLWAQRLRPLFILQHRLRRLLGGMYCQRPFAYDIYTLASPDRRQHCEVTNPRAWKSF